MDLLTTIEIEAIKLSLKISFWALLWSLPLALGTAWILARHHFPGKFIFDGIIHLPLVLPPVVIGYVLLVLMGKKGLIGSFLYEELGISAEDYYKLQDIQKTLGQEYVGQTIADDDEFAFQDFYISHYNVN